MANDREVGRDRIQCAFEFICAVDSFYLCRLCNVFFFLFLMIRQFGILENSTSLEC